MAGSCQSFSVIPGSLDAAIPPKITQAPIDHQDALLNVDASNLSQIRDLSKPSHLLNDREASPMETLLDQTLVSGPSPLSSSPRLHWKKGMLSAKYHPLPSQADTISSPPEARKVSRCSLKRPKQVTLSASHPHAHHTHLHYCKPCDRHFASTVYLKIHLRYFHSADKSFICRICNSETKLLTSFKFHLASLHKKTWQQYLQMVEFVLIGDHTQSDSCQSPSPGVNLTQFPSPARPLPSSKSLSGSDESSRADGSKSGSKLGSVYKQRCDTCARLFVSKYTLEEHIAVQHRGQRFVCLICSQQIKYKSTLATHVKQVHGMPMRKYSQLADY